MRTSGSWPPVHQACRFLLPAALALLTAVAARPAGAQTPVVGTISVDTTWTAAGSPYLASGVVSIAAGATLTVEPGVVVKFAEYGELLVNGTLAVGGAPGDPVIFTDERDDTAGGDSNGDGDASAPASRWWRGVWVQDGGAAAIDRAEIRYGGLDGAGVYAEGAGPVHLSNTRLFRNQTGLIVSWSAAEYSVSGCVLEENDNEGARLDNASGDGTISGSSFTANGSYGLLVVRSSPAIVGNAFTGNSPYGLFVWLAPIPVAVRGNTLSGNTSGAILLGGEASGTFIEDDNVFSGPLVVGGGWIRTDVSWASNRTYVTQGSLSVEPGATLTIPAGRVVKFLQDLQVSGALAVEGTADSPVVMTDRRDDTAGGDTNGDGDASAPAAGGWAGIRVLEGGAATIDHAEIRYAGAYGGWSSYSSLGGLYKTGAGSVLLANSRFYRNASAGARLGLGNGPHIVSACSFEENAGIGLSLEDLTGPVLVAESAFTGNASHGLQVLNSSPTITGNRVEGNGGYGLYVQGSPVPATVSGNALGGNATAAVGTDANGSGVMVSDDNDFVGPLHVEGGTIDQDIAWTTPRTHYVKGALSVAAGTTLTVTAGRVAKFPPNVGLEVSGTLLVGGTAAEPVVFTDYRDDAVGGDSNGDGAASLPASGQWRGIVVWGGGEASIDGAEIRYGGRVASADSTTLGGLSKEGPGSLVLHNSRFWMNRPRGLLLRSSVDTHAVSGCLFEENVGAGVELEGLAGEVTINGNVSRGNASHGLQVRNSAPAVTANTLTGNGGYGMYLQGCSRPGVVSANELGGNAGGQFGMDPDGSGAVVQDDNVFSGPLYVEPGTPGCDVTWASGRTYYLRGAFEVAPGRNLTVPAGRVVKFAQSALVRVRGALNVAGAEGQPAVFTDFRDDSSGGDSNGDGDASVPAAGWWNGIIVADGGSAVIDRAEVRYGGYAWAGVFKEGGGTLALTDSRLYRNKLYGVLLQSSTASHTITGCTIEETAGPGGLLQGLTGAVSVTGNAFVNNVSHGLQVTRSAVAVEGNTFSGNGGFGLLVQGSPWPSPVHGNALDGNTLGQVGADPDGSGVALAGNVFNGPLTVTGGHLTADLSWSGDRTYAIGGTLTVDAGRTLNVTAGRIVKFVQNGQLTVSGRLAATGAAGLPVYFTDIRDDSVGGDGNGDGDVTTPAPGWWKGIVVQGSGTAALEQVEVRYGGGAGAGLYKSGSGGIQVADARFFRNSGAGAYFTASAAGVRVSGCSFEGNVGVGAWLYSVTGQVEVVGSSFASNTSYGLLLDYTAGVIAGNAITGNAGPGVGVRRATATPAVRGNIISANSVGIKCELGGNPLVGGSAAEANDLSGNSLYGVQNTMASVTVNARFNWWGDASGPFHATTNPEGLGVPVSDYVDYGDYLVAPPGAAAGHIEVAPPSWDFGAVLPGEAAVHTWTVTNSGVLELALGAFAVGGQDPGEFEIRDNACPSGGTLAPGESCGFAVAYLRSAAGSKTAQVEIASDDPDAPVLVVVLLGKGATCTPPPPGLASWWRAEGNAEDTVGGNEGALAGGADYSPGFVGQAFHFNGDGAVVEIPGDVGSFGGAPFTVEFMVRPGGAGSDMYLIGASEPESGLGWDVRLDGAAVEVNGVSGWSPSYNVRTEPLVPPDAWHHVAVASSTETVEVYIDGQLRGAVARLPIPPSASALRIGAPPGATGNAFLGLVDEARIYGRALDAAEIGAIAASDGGVCPGPRLEVSPASWDFGDVVVGDASAPMEVVLSNVGLAPLSVKSVAVAGVDQGAFSVVSGGTSPCPDGLAPTLGPGEGCTFRARFSPAGAGASVAWLAVDSDDPYQGNSGASLEGRGLWRLTVVVSPADGGTVRGGGGIDCPAAACSATADSGALELAAEAAPGYSFAGWGGDVAGSGPQVSVAMDGHKLVTAGFSRPPRDRVVCAAGCEYPTVQAALDDAGPGDAIVVGAGIYQENLVLGGDRRVTVRGSGVETVISGAGSGPVLFLRADAGDSLAVHLEDLAMEGGFAAEGGGISAEAEAGGILELSLANVVLHHNTAAGSGGALLARSSGPGSALSVDLVNVTVGDNVAERGGGIALAATGGGTATGRAMNVVLWGNQAAGFPGESDLSLQPDAPGAVLLHARSSDIGMQPLPSDSYVPGGSMLDVDPVYLNPALGEYHLHRDSPCIDQGEAGWSPPVGDAIEAPAVDFEGEVRPPDAVDQGADEFQAAADASFRLQSLRGGEIISSGRPYNIAWEAPPKLAKFKVFFSSNKGSTWKRLTRSAVRDHHWSWTPPRPRRTRRSWRVKVVAYSAGGKRLKVLRSGLFTVSR